MDELLPWLALLSGLVVGGALGLTGGGGSIFALPLLVYLLGVPLREAVALSLAVVGLTALFGAVMQRKNVLWGAGAMLGVGGIAGAPPGAMLGAALPETLVLSLFAGLMLFIGYRLWRGGSNLEIPIGRFTCARDTDGELRFHWPCAVKLALAGAATGLLAGIFGVGGGFLVVPALILVTAMPLHQVVATSLVGIALVSASAFVSNLAAAGSLPLATGALFLAGALPGMIAGTATKSRCSPRMLQRLFAAAVVGVALYVLLQATGLLPAR